MFSTILGERSGLILLLCLQFLVWGLFAPLFHSSHPLDVVELTTLSNEWVIANYKHPNLPGLLLDLMTYLTGPFWSVYLLSQFSIIAAYLCVYNLGKELVGSTQSLVSVLLLSSVFYYHWPTPEFNHNVLQIPLWALAILSVWRAVSTNSLGWWLVLGMTAGALLWTKYSAGVLLLVISVWLIVEPKAREQLLTPYPWLAAAVAIVIALPQILYLLESDFLPFSYAANRASEGSAVDAVKFIAAQLANHFLFLILIAIAGLLGRGMVIPSKPIYCEDISKDKSKALGHSSKEVAPLRNPNPKLFLLIMGLGPLLVVALLPVLAGVGLRSMWGAPMFNLSGLLFVYFLSGRLNASRIQRLKISAFALMVTLGSAYVAQHLLRATISDKPMRTQWPQAEIARYFHAEYLNKANTPLKFVVSDYWLGGLIASAPVYSTRVKVDGDDLKSPWISDEQLLQQGALVAWPASSGPNANQLDLLKRAGTRASAPHTGSFQWSADKPDSLIKIEYQLILPRD